MAAEMRRGKRRRVAVGEIGEALEDRDPPFLTHSPTHVHHVPQVLIRVLSGFISGPFNFSYHGHLDIHSLWAMP